MLLISDMIDWYSWFAADSCVGLRVPLEASVASVMARLSRLVTCERAPSATSSNPTPSVELVLDWVRADELAWSPLIRESPAASSAPELILEPDDNCRSTFCRLLLVLFRLFSSPSASNLPSSPCIKIWFANL